MSTNFKGGLAIALFLLPLSVHAHEWYTQQVNEKGQHCCGGYDCAVIPSDRVRQLSPTKYEVTIRVGDMPSVNEQNLGGQEKVMIFEGNPGLSPDGNIHACVTYTEAYLGKVRCLFIGGLS